MTEVAFCLLQLLTAEIGTDQRSPLPRQPHQVSEGKLTCQRGSWEVAATAACDPKRSSRSQNVGRSFDCGQDNGLVKASVLRSQHTDLTQASVFR
jgi:hypothetical protein